MEYYWLLLILLMVLAITVIYQFSPQKRLQRARRRVEREKLKEQQRIAKEMEAKLLSGDLSPALHYFWSRGNVNRVRSFLQSRQELPLLSEGFWGEFWSNSPDFRRIVNTAFENAVRLKAVAYDPNNVFLPQELRLHSEEVLGLCTHNLWQACHRLSILTRSGADKRHIKPALQKMAQELNDISQVLFDATYTLNNYTAVAGNIGALDAAKATLASLAGRAKDMEEAEGAVRRELGSLPSQGIWGDRLTDMPKKNEKEPVPRRSVKRDDTTSPN